jgi:hypothetical protein
MKRTVIRIFLAVLALALTASMPAQATMNHKKTDAALTKSAVDLRIAMRQLWDDHMVYTRNFIISGLAGLDDAGKVAERLLRNQDDIGNAIKPVYGEEAGNKLTALLKDHILIAADIVKAAKVGDNDGVAKGQEKWRGNADDIALFLSKANPNWPLDTMKNMLYKHLATTTGEVVSRVKKDWPADIAAYDEGVAHMMMFADMLTDGIVKQFPSKFAK